MSWPGQASEHDADHSEMNEGCGGARVSLEVACEASVVADPSESSLDDPAFWENDEAMQLVAFDDFQLPSAGLGDSRGGLCSLIAGIGEDALDKGKKATGTPIENERCTIAILHIGRMDDDVQQEAERVDENMPFAAPNLLARIKALRVERGAPF
jgi:hypothetical protein